MKNRSHIKGSSRRRENRKRTVMVLLIMVLCLSGSRRPDVPMQLRTHLRTYLRIYPRPEQSAHPGNRREYSGCHNH